MNKKKFDFSVIVPVYQAENYLEEAIQSVIKQSIGFEDHIQLILVNDGSKDRSEDICKTYLEKYPDNISYTVQDNAGVSAARNRGIELARGELVTFLDSDDRWEHNAFLSVWEFYRKHEGEIEVISARDRYFEGETGYHILDYKTERGTRIVDLNQEAEWHSIQSRISVFIKKDVAKQFRFKMGLKYGEDSLFVNSIILRTMKYGLVKEAIYEYRKRTDGDSAMQRQKGDKDYYLSTIEQFHLELYRISEKRYGSIKSYIQAAVYYDLGGRLKTEQYKEVLSVQETARYLELLKKVFQEIDDKIYMKNPVHISFFVRRVAFFLKYGEDLYNFLSLSEDNSKIMYQGISVANIKKNKSGCFIDHVERNGDNLYVCGRISAWYLKALHAEFFLEGADRGEFEISEDESYIYHTMFGSQIRFYKFILLVSGISGRLNITLKPRLRQEGKILDIGWSPGEEMGICEKDGMAYKILPQIQYKINRRKLDIIINSLVMTRKIFWFAEKMARKFGRFFYRKIKCCNL